MCCNKKVGKAILIFLNLIFFVLGIVCIAAGVFILVDKTILTSALSKIPSVAQTLDQAVQVASLLERSAYVIIGVGVVIFLIGFCGCCGAYKEIRCLLYIYLFVVIIILAAQISGAILGFIYKDRAIAYLQTFLNDTIAQKYEGLQITNGALTESLEPFSAAWDIAMITLECCGNYNYTDFKNYAVNWNGTYNYNGVTVNAEVPISCCKTTDKVALIADLAHFSNYFTNATECVTTADPMYTNTINCYDKILLTIDQYTKIVIGICIGIACVELLAIICACSVIRAIGKDQD